MKDRIIKSRALRAAVLRHLYATRLDNPVAPWVWRRDLEQEAGAPLAFELDYLVERGDLAQDGPKYRITAQGIDRIEAESA